MDESHDHDKKPDRHRKRKFYNDIRQQIEFYLGDVNLSKDRFFNSLLQESPYIDVDIILRCNKIRKFTSKPKDIVKALKNSQLLSVTEDGNKIYRTVPVKIIDNADECTIYVEDLPPEADHEWLKSVFQKYGEIAYVSVPRYKNNNKIKGFAFVQFNSPQSAINALKAFQSVNSCLSSSISPTQLRSVKTFEGEKDVVVIDHNKTGVDEIKIIPIKHEATDSSEEPAKKKRKKERKENDVTTNSTEESSTHKEDSGKENDTKTEDCDRLKNEGTDTENYSDEKHTKKRKRKKKKKESVQTYGMQILSKQEWKRLRNKYLEEQRKKMHELKEQLRKARLNREQDVPVEEELPAVECRVKFTPGVIVKLKLDQTITNIKNFKTEVKRYANVEYIDVSEDDPIAYFRCSSNEVANQVIALNKWPNMEILKGEEELEYWEKIKEDRKKKVSEKIRSKTRGKTKLIKKVETAVVKHIKFSD